MTTKKKAGDWESWIDQQIREARERGEFDNLAGKGQPLDLTPNPYARDRELAFKILKDAGFAPEWIELDKAIRKKIDMLRGTLARNWTWSENRLVGLQGRSDGWAAAERERTLAGRRAAVASFREEVKAINKEIEELNLKVPAPQFQRSQLDADRELARLEDE